MKKLIFLLPVFLLSFTFTSDNPPGWYPIPKPIAPMLREIVFADSLHGWSICNWLPANDTSYLINSTDAGESWNLQFAAPFCFKNVYFFNKDTGYIGANNGEGISSDGDGIIFRTLDGGESWDTLSYLDTFQLDGMQFLDPNTGWVYTNGAEYDNSISRGNTSGGLMKTTNAGENWVVQTSDLVESAFFVDSVNGWYSSYIGNPSKIYHTTNGGVNWTEQVTGVARTMFFLTPDKGWITGGIQPFMINNGAFYTTNGGANWHGCSGQSVYNKILMITDSIGYSATGYGFAMLKSTNGGRNWWRQYCPMITSTSVFALKGDTSVIWAAGSRIAKTTDGGGPVSVSQIGSELPEGYKLSQNYPNPFNPETRIEFSVQKSGNVSLRVFNSLGQEVKELVNKELSAGSYSVNFNAGNHSSGVYYYTLTTDGFTQTKKMLLVK